jgi:hypothetical protein
MEIISMQENAIPSTKQLLSVGLRMFVRYTKPFDGIESTMEILSAFRSGAANQQAPIRESAVGAAASSSPQLNWKSVEPFISATNPNPCRCTRLQHPAALSARP